jgi:hypothetical protein
MAATRQESKPQKMQICVWTHFSPLFLVIFIDQENSFHLGRVNKPLNRYPDVSMALGLSDEIAESLSDLKLCGKGKAPHPVVTITKEGSSPASQFNEGSIDIIQLPPFPLPSFA